MRLPPTNQGYRMVVMLWLIFSMLNSLVDCEVNIATINALSVDSYVPRTLALERVRGIEAAVLEANNHGGIEGESIVFKAYDDVFDRTLVKVRERIREVLQDNITALTMQGLLSEFAMGMEGAEKFPTFTPWSLRNEAYEYPMREKIHLRVPFESEMNNMMHFGMNSRIRCKQFVIGYSPFGPLPGVAENANRTLVKLGLPPARLVLLPDTDVENHKVQETKLISAIFNEYPIGQCVVFWNGDSIFSAIKRIVQHPKYDPENMYFFGPSISAFPNMSAFGPMSSFGNLFFTLPTPGPEERQWAVVRNYQAAYDDLETANTSITNRIPYHYTYAGLEAYVGARVLVEAMRRAYPHHKNQTKLIDTVFETRYFAIDDLTLGPYKDGCKGAETGALTACWCTSGVKQLFTARVNGTTGAVEPVNDDLDLGEKNIASPLISLKDCTYQASALQSPHVVIVPHNVSTNHTAATKLLRALSRSFAENPIAGKNFGAASLAIDRSEFEVNDAAKLVDRFAVNAVAFSSVNNTAFSQVDSSLFSLVAPLQSNGEFFNEDVYGSGQVAARRDVPWNPSTISFWPSMVDYIHTAMSFVHDLGGKATLVTTEESLIQPALDSATTFGVSLRALQRSTVTSDDFSGEKVVVIVSQRPDILDDAFEFAAASTPSMKILICTSDLVLSRHIEESSIVRALMDKRYSARKLEVENDVVVEDARLFDNMYFTTGISSFDPKFNVFETYATIVREMFTAVAALLPPTFTSAEFTRNIYSTSTIGSSHATIGPFDNTPCDVKNPSAYCQCAKGLLRFYVHPLLSMPETHAAVFNKPNSSSKALFTHIHKGCGVTYHLESSETPVSTDLVVALLIVVLVVALISFTAIKLIRNSSNTPLRTLARSPLWTTGMRIVFQSLDMITDIVACYIVLDSNISVAFSVLFSILTLMALFANIFELRTVVMYFLYLLNQLSNYGNVDLEVEAEERKEWNGKLGISAVLTLIFEDLPMCTMTSYAISNNPAQPFLFVSLILSAALMGSKLINLRDVGLSWLRERWSLTDNEQLENEAKKLHPSLSLSGMQHALTSHSSADEKAFVRRALERALKETVRLEELSDASNRAQSLFMEMKISPTEYYAFVESIVQEYMDAQVHTVEKLGTFSRKETMSTIINLEGGTPVTDTLNPPVMNPIPDLGLMVESLNQPRNTTKQ